MATIKQVAEKAGVSVATVSYVLNDTHKVRPATERRVLLAAEELGYSPNSTARSLVVGRSSLVGLIVPDLGNPFFPEITKAFQDAASLAGMETIVINTDYDVQRTRSTVNRLLSLQVPGAAFLTSQVEPAVRQALAEKGICAVYLDHGVSGPHMSGIAIDYENGIHDAVEYLLRLGHRRLGFIGGHAHGVSARQRKIAFQESVSAAPGAEGRVVDSDFSVQGGYFACSRLLNGFDATAILAANDLMAIGALHCAYDRQIPVPAKLSIIGFDDITFAQFTQPSLTTIAVPREEIGRLAFQSLSSLITAPHQAGREYSVKTALVIRQTAAAAPEVA